MSTPRLENFLGLGHDPKLQLQLGANGPDWKSFTIDYGQTGNIPTSDSPGENWSAWNVIDENNNYYGTITLDLDSSPPTCTYKESDTGYELEGIHLKTDPANGNFQLNVDTIIRPTNGPFPNTPLATPALYNNTNTPIQLSTQGSEIIDNQGRPVILKGMVRPSLEWNPSGQFLSPQDITNMASWGGNVIRLDLNQNYWFDSAPITTQGSYKQIIDAIIYYATQNNMAVILDLHWTENGTQSPMANRQSIQFWQEVATQYKNFGTVIFELFNEPFGISQDVWLNGDGVNYAGYQELYKAVRDTAGADNLVICNGLDYGYDVSFINDNFGIIGNNIIYGSHPYNDKGADNYQGPGGSLANNLKGIVNEYPFIFTEFGINTQAGLNNYQEIYQRNLNFLNNNKGNYNAFAWWAGDPLFPSLIQDWQGTPLNGGVLIKPDMASATPFFKPHPCPQMKPKQDSEANNDSQRITRILLTSLAITTIALTLVAAFVSIVAAPLAVLCAGLFAYKAVKSFDSIKNWLFGKPKALEKTFHPSHTTISNSLKRNAAQQSENRTAPSIIPSAPPKEETFIQSSAPRPTTLFTSLNLSQETRETIPNPAMSPRI